VHKVGAKLEPQAERATRLRFATARGEAEMLKLGVALKGLNAVGGGWSGHEK
jgi:hypothetical protein